MDGSSENLIHYLNPNHPPLSGHVIDDNNAASLSLSHSLTHTHTHTHTFIPFLSLFSSLFPLNQRDAKEQNNHMDGVMVGV